VNVTTDSFVTPNLSADLPRPFSSRGMVVSSASDQSVAVRVGRDSAPVMVPGIERRAAPAMRQVLGNYYYDTTGLHERMFAADRGSGAIVSVFA
jgi:hypothetical protein